MFFGDGLYWIAPYDLEPIQVYCDMTTDGGGWTMFSEVVSNTDNFGSKPVYAGTFDFGEVGDTAYSLSRRPLHQAVDEEFDVMMQYGEEEFIVLSNIIIKVWKSFMFR